MPEETNIDSTTLPQIDYDLIRNLVLEGVSTGAIKDPFETTKSLIRCLKLLRQSSDQSN